MKHPNGAEVVENQTVSFSALADDATSYQWQRHPAAAADGVFSDIVGATLSTYSFVASAADHGSSFRVVARNASGDTYSPSATLSVYSVPVITTSPANARVVAPGLATFQVVASGVGLEFRWQVRRPTDGDFIGIASVGSDSPTYSEHVPTVDMSGTQYRVLVSNPAGTATSETAELTVDAPLLLQWHPVDPDPQNPSSPWNSLNFQGGYFADPQHGMLVGAGGAAVSSSDSGATWVVRDAAMPHHINNVHFVDRMHGWMVSSGGQYTYSPSPGSWNLLVAWGGVARTTNGGETWQVMNPTPDQVTGQFYDFDDVWFVDAATGWIVGAGGQIYKTTDAGASWVKQDGGTNERLRRVRFVDPQRGFVMGKDEAAQGVFILRTVDGGATWTRTNLATNDFTYAVTDLGFSSRERGWATTGNCVFRTDNGGETWFQSGCVEVNIVAMAVSAGGVLYVKGDEESLYVSADGGATFARLVWGGASVRYISHQRLFMSSDKTIWTVGSLLTLPRYVVIP